MSKKQSLRQECLRRRRWQPDQTTHSLTICQSLIGLPEWRAAQRVLLYVGVRSEVQTLFAMQRGWAARKQIAVPFCDGNLLRPCLVESGSELAPGAFRIPEPRPELRSDESQRRWQPTDLDLVVVPGVAFDLQGNRLGHGHGYYDRLLAAVRPDTCRVGLAFDCQLLPQLDTEPHDERVHLLITESGVQRIAC